MAEDYGTCVVAVPKDAQTLPINVDGGPHITIAYFGDERLENKNLSDLMELVGRVVDFFEENFYNLTVMTDKISDFGPNGTVKVIEMDVEGDPTISNFRQVLLDNLTPELDAIFKANETYPEYRPHLTLGDTADGYSYDLSDVNLPFVMDIASIEIWDGVEKSIFPIEASIDHYGTPRHSGRYPWGSGNDPYQSSRSFMAYVDELTGKGLSEKEVASAIGISMRELRDLKSISKNEIRKENIHTAIKLKEKQMSNVAIAERLGVSEANVRNMLKESEQQKLDRITATADALKKNLETSRFLDVGAGTEYHMNISQTQLNAALTKLKLEGYRVDTIKQEQLGTGHETSIKVLSPPGTEYKDITRNRDQIGTVAVYSDNNGVSFRKPSAPLPIDPSRVAVRYAEEHGVDSDGVIYVRRGVDDISLGNARYAQVRIAVGDGHFLKGMAMYSDDMPKGVDLLFNTNKKQGTPMLGDKNESVLKPIKDDPEFPFGTVVRNKYYTDANGKEHQSVLNIVNEEGDWLQWSKTLSSQMLSKQSPAIARQQLEISAARKQAELDEILALTNPTIKKKLLTSFADSADSAAVNLKAAALPRTMNHVILPINDLKENEIYAPRYNNGEKVVLIRHPHGGKFEIPELIVNNKNKTGERLITNTALDAVGINSKVAERLSGADFDGDTVLVIPNNKGYIKTQQPLADLKNFNPAIYARDYDTIDNKTKQLEMGKISNLITDMTIKGATDAELARAVRHSMVVIDAEKHRYDYKQSAIDNSIASLKKRYQGRSNAGASTLISQASKEIKIPERTLRKAKDGGPVDPLTGKKVYVETGAIRPAYTDKNGKYYAEKPKVTKISKMAYTDDANTLSSGRPIEQVYASYANSLKSMANYARKESLVTPNLKYSPSAAKVYAPQVDRLKSALGVALKNAPLERQAQLLASTTFRQIRKSDPDMPEDKVKSIKGKLLTEARQQVGAHKTRIAITPVEWEAIQAGAISNNMLTQILANTDLDTIKAYATPKTEVSIPPSKESRAQAMLAIGYTQAEIANALGISVSSVSRIAKG